MTQVLLDILNPVSNYSHSDDPVVTAAAICAINNLACGMLVGDDVDGEEAERKTKKEGEGEDRESR